VRNKTSFFCKKYQYPETTKRYEAIKTARMTLRGMFGIVGVRSLSCGADTMLKGKKKRPDIFILKKKISIQKVIVCVLLLKTVCFQV